LLNKTDRPTQAGTGAAAARRTLLASLLTAGLMLVLPPRARAQPSVSVESAELELRDNPEPGLYLNAQFAFEPSPAIEDAIRRGIPVYFSIDFELVRTRWYWFSRILASATLVYRLSYSPLTRQFRRARAELGDERTELPGVAEVEHLLSRGALAQPFDTLDEALAAIRTVRGWKVAGGDVARVHDHLLPRVRLKLDTTMLPKPFQVDSLTNHDWALASGWRPVTIVASSQR
jgi:hypothetical protein